MKILFYSTKAFEKPFLLAAAKDHQPHFVEEALSITTVPSAAGYDVISVFTADDASAPVLRELAGLGVQMIAVRAAGYDNVDLEAARENKIAVANVPEYSPYSVAEHAIALIMALNRKIIKANRQVHERNFLLDELIGIDLNGKTVGIIGTGRIGSVLAKILFGFGCKILAYDTNRNHDLVNRYDVQYVSLPILCSRADIISIHTPLTPETKYMINETLIQQMQKGVMLINTARGGVVHTAHLIPYLESGHIGCYGSDVYEREKGIFFFDKRGEDLHEPMLDKLLKLDNVLITPHQAFATREALENIATTSFFNIECWRDGVDSGNELVSFSAPLEVNPVGDKTVSAG